MLDSFLHTNNVKKNRKVNGYTPFFRAFFGVFGDIERICSVFQADFKPVFDSKVGGLNRSEWVGMLRFRQEGEQHCCRQEDPLNLP